MVAVLLTCSAAALAPLLASAADYPTKPITIVVGYAAGGGVDEIPMWKQIAVNNNIKVN